MTRRLRLALLTIVALWGAAFVGVAQAQEAGAVTVPSKPVVQKQVRVWAYVGPRGYLAGAKVTLKDRTGKTIATGTTGPRGTYAFDLAGRSSVKLPLTVSTSGGKITATVQGTTVLAAPFKGRMSAMVFNATTRNPITHVNLITTAASQIADTKKGYAAAIAKVRTTIGFPKSAPDDALQYRNSHVGFRRLILVSRSAGGFDAFATKVARAAKNGKRIKGLRPASANASAAIPARLISAKVLKNLPAKPVTTLPFVLPKRKATPAARQQSTAPSNVVCQVGVPNEPTTGGISDEVITDVADVGVGALMKVAGVPTAATNSITGMALGAVGVSQQTAQEQDLALISEDLDCIGDQLNYLSGQISELQFTVDLIGAVNCASQIDGAQAWEGYEWVTSSNNTTPLDQNNKSLKETYVPTWNTVRTTCANNINSALWGSAGGNKSAWTQLVANTRKGGKWYSPSQIQQLQTFLSYWGMKYYQQFILTNEYFNFTGDLDTARQNAGTTKDSAGNTLCVASQTSSACWTRNNIKQAYPGSLFSDELGVVSNGTSYNAIPLGVFAGKAITNPASGMAATQSKYIASRGNTSGSATSVMPAWVYNYYLNWTPYDSNGNGNRLRIFNYGLTPDCVTKVKDNCPGPTKDIQTLSFAWTAPDWFNKIGINPKGYGSAIQTYENPQATNRSGSWTTCPEVNELNSNNGLTGQKGVDALYAALNQTGAFSSYKSGEILYMGSDWKVNYHAQMYKGNTSYPVGYMEWYGCFGPNNSGLSYNYSDLPTKPIFVTLTSRDWWPGASAADTLDYRYLKAPSGPQ